jgi:hypothetical protein
VKGKWPGRVGGGKAMGIWEGERGERDMAQPLWLFVLWANRMRGGGLSAPLLFSPMAPTGNRNLSPNFGRNFSISNSGGNERIVVLLLFCRMGGESPFLKVHHTFRLGRRVREEWMDMMRWMFKSAFFGLLFLVTWWNMARQLTLVWANVL